MQRASRGAGLSCVSFCGAPARINNARGPLLGASFASAADATQLSPDSTAGPLVIKLTPEQKQAAAIGSGPVRVVAGAGTGKTSVIAERFAQLIDAGMAAESILVMTFTERAAAEMRVRIEERIGGTAPAVGTFHSIALGWLRDHGVANFRIVAGADRWILARELMWEIGDPVLTGEERPDDLVAPLLQLLERLKQELVPLEKLAAWAEHADDPERAELMLACVRLFRAYERECRKQRLLDFDDLLVSAVRMLERRPALREVYRRRFPAVLVDEYQDLNLAQERLVELVASPQGELCVVGDDDQSIYRFRGASRASLARFSKSFPTARTVTLARNHRSSSRILAAASALIAHNPERLPKELSSRNAAGAAVQVWECDDSTGEAAAIAQEAEKLHAAGMPLRQIAVLCRTNAIARPIAAALSARGLPHVVTGGRGFFDRAEIRDVIAMLRVLLDPNDVIAMERVRTRPPAQKLTPSQLTELAAVATSTDVRDVLFELMERTSYLPALGAQLEASEAARAVSNVSHFADLVGEFCDFNPDHSLANYMRHLDLVLLSGEDEEPAAVEGLSDAIQVMTIHQAKGLEFDCVFVPSLVEGRLPQSGRSQRFELPPSVLEPLVRGREDVIAEERRLLYVAMTRAKRLLYLTRATHYEGGRRWRDSRFVAEVLTAPARAVVEKKVAGCEPAATPALSPLLGPEPSLSFSAIDSYRDCPRQYWYRHVRKLPAVQSAEAVHGVILHKALQRAGELRQKGEEVSLEIIRRLHLEAWAEATFPDPRRAPTFKRIGLRQLERFVEGGGFKDVPVHIEQDFAASLEGWSLRGVIDRVDRAGDRWKIVDYKSGRRLNRGRRDLQVALYALGAKSALALDPLELEVVYLASGETIKVDTTPSLLAEAVRLGGEVADGVRAQRFEARPERRKCRLCSYRLACAEAL